VKAREKHDGALHVARSRAASAGRRRVGAGGKREVSLRFPTVRGFYDRSRKRSARDETFAMPSIEDFERKWSFAVSQQRVLDKFIGDALWRLRAFTSAGETMPTCAAGRPRHVSRAHALNGERRPAARPHRHRHPECRRAPSSSAISGSAPNDGIHGDRLLE